MSSMDTEKDVEVIDCDLGTQTSTSEEERIANDAAAEFCTPTGQVDNFILRKMPFISERDVLALSARLNRHPGLVVGQIQKKLMPA